MLRNARLVMMRTSRSVSMAILEVAARVVNSGGARPIPATGHRGSGTIMACPSAFRGWGGPGHYGLRGLPVRDIGAKQMGPTSLPTPLSPMRGLDRQLNETGRNLASDVFPSAASEDAASGSVTGARTGIRLHPPTDPVECARP